jgi:hypothetical protein
MRPLRAQLIAALTVLSVLLPGSAFARTQYFCRMMNRVVSTCCCEAQKHRDAEVSRSPKVRPTDCCQKVTASDRTATASTSKIDCSVPEASIAEAPAPLAFVASRTFTLVAPSIQARAPPSIGPPLFIAHCSLLT